MKSREWNTYIYILKNVFRHQKSSLLPQDMTGILCITLKTTCHETSEMQFKEYNKWVWFEGGKFLSKSSQIQVVFLFSSFLLQHWYTVCDLNQMKTTFNLKPNQLSIHYLKVSIVGGWGSIHKLRQKLGSVSGMEKGYLHWFKFYLYFQWKTTYLQISDREKGDYIIPFSGMLEPYIQAVCSQCI